MNHEVAATYDADSGIVEVFPVDRARSGVFLGIRPDVGHGAFVRLTAAEVTQLVALLAPVEARPLGPQGVIAKVEFWLRARGWERAARFLGRVDEIGLGR